MRKVSPTIHKKNSLTYKTILTIRKGKQTCKAILTIHKRNPQIKNVECPICHGKNGDIDAIHDNVFASFKCPDCGALICRSGHGDDKIDEFKAWLDKHLSAPKKD